MLRILRDDVAADRVVLNLQGQIVGDWADLLERVCAEINRPGLGVALDLADVTVIGRAGLKSLSRLSRAGVGIVRCSPLIADLLAQEGIVGGRTPAGESRRTPRRTRSGRGDA